MRLTFISCLFLLAGCSAGRDPGDPAVPEQAFVVIAPSVEGPAGPRGVTVSDGSFEVAAGPASRPEPYIAASDLSVDEADGFIISLSRPFDDYDAFQRLNGEYGKGHADPQVIGKMTVSLGTVTDGGIWARADFVTSPIRAVLRDPATGASVRAEIRPARGPDSMSLEAYRALGIDPREISRITVEEMPQEP